MHGDFYAYTITASKAILILLSFGILLRCLRSMLRESYDPETWGYLRYGRDRLPIQHWEVIIGRSPDCDIYVPEREVARTHAVLRRNDLGEWRVYDVFSRGGVWVNNVFVDDDGVEVNDGDVLNLNGICLRFCDLDMEKRERLESRRSGVGRRYSPALTLLMLTAFQLFLLLQHSFYAEPETLSDIALGFLSLIVMEWSCFNAMRIINRAGFEIETLAFYLSSLGMSVAASSTPEDLYKQILLTLAGLILFLLCGWWQRSLKRTASARFLVAAAALLLLGINVVASDVVLGARNWLEFWGFSFQPSELVKTIFIFVGASPLDKLQTKRNLIEFIIYSAVCVALLALMSDFGTALIFFVTFLLVVFMRSGDIKTILLPVAAVVGAFFSMRFLASIIPAIQNRFNYVLARFGTYRHVWDDPQGGGWQQAQALTYIASGGLFGVGIGNGYFKTIPESESDCVFALISEEMGIILAIVIALAVALLIVYARAITTRSRSTFYSITACCAAGLLLVQLSLNVFGCTDILPFTGVTFPFISAGGSSMISCWGLLAFIKAADERTYSIKR